MTFFFNPIIAAIIAGTPLLLATLGEIIAERGGIINLGLEGLMLVGALVGFAVSHYTNIPVIGLLAAIIAGGVISSIHAFLTITLSCNQIVSGLALTIFGSGITSFFGRGMIGQIAPGFKPVLFRLDSIALFSVILVVVVWVFLNKTRWGLSLKSVGENPTASDAMGLNVFRIRYTGVILGGMLAGMGGAYLSLAYTKMWLENMATGKGWIAIALVIFAVWDPIKALLGSYLFGAVMDFTFRIQTLGGGVPVWILKKIYIIKMAPYIVTILVLTFVTVFEGARKKMGAPEALGVPFHRA